MGNLNLKSCNHRQTIILRVNPVKSLSSCLAYAKTGKDTFLFRPIESVELICCIIKTIIIEVTSRCFTENFALSSNLKCQSKYRNCNGRMLLFYIFYFYMVIIFFGRLYSLNIVYYCLRALELIGC